MEMPIADSWDLPNSDSTKLHSPARPALIAILQQAAASCQTVRHSPQLAAREHRLSMVSDQNFWRLAAALRNFVENEGDGQLPIRGSLPDMTSDSTRYLRLLNIYREESEWAVDRLATRLSQFPEITRQDIQLFVRNSAFLRVINSRRLEEELRLSPATSEDHESAVPPRSASQDDESLMWYLALRSACGFLGDTGRWPGCSRAYTTPISAAETKRQRLGGHHTPSPDLPQSPVSAAVLDTDLSALKEHFNRLLHTFGIASDRASLAYLDEVCRFGGGELHTVAAFMGGVAAHEVIKLITHQFIPVRKPLIYNAITQRTDLLDL